MNCIANGPVPFYNGGFIATDRGRPLVAVPRGLAHEVNVVDIQIGRSTSAGCKEEKKPTKGFGSCWPRAIAPFFALETHPESPPATALSSFGGPNGRIEA